VGYTIRLDDLSSAKTRIRFVTEGVLVRQMISRPNLEGVQAVLCDEFHERHLYGDLTLGRILNLQESARPDLVLVVMSATLETEKLARTIGAEVLRSEGRMYPVEMRYLPKREDLSGSEREADGGATVAEGGGGGGGVDADAVHQHREAVDAGESGAQGLTEADGHGGAVNGQLKQRGDGHDSG
jgi:ATP-dependent helicase HrpB